MNTLELVHCAESVISGQSVSPDEALALLSLPDADTPLLLALADKIRRHFRGDDVDCCAIVNGRSGRCSENCRFCAQSSHYPTDTSCYGLLSEEKLAAAAEKACANGAVRFSIVTSGRSVEKGREFTAILRALRRIRRETGLETCCSLGLIDAEQACALKDAGLSRYHANIETAPSYFPSICSTHTIADKITLIKRLQQAGLTVCSGGIIGLGESPAQRIEMAFTLKRLGISSVPLNILTPVAGTPLASMAPLPPWDILRTFAVFRFILPEAQIRTAGGREANLRSLQAFALTGGADGLMIGGYLTTPGNAVSADMAMLRDLNRRPARLRRQR